MPAQARSAGECQESAAGSGPVHEDFSLRDAAARAEVQASLGDKAARSFLWRGGASAVSVLTRVAVMGVLARVLAPHVFGVAAMSVVVTGFAGSLAEFGLGSAVIQRPNLTGGQLWWVFRINLFASTALAIACVAVSPLAARFFHEPLAAPVIAVSACILPISATALVPRALLVRYLEFRKLAACELANSIVNGIVSIAAALCGMGVWSLVLGSAAGASAGTAGLLLSSPWRPARAERAEGRAALLAFGGSVALLGILNYWAYSIDNVIVGRVLGSAALGVYAVAFNLAVIPAATLSGLVAAVAFPAFSALQADGNRLALAYLRCLRWSAGITLPFVALLAVLAPQVVAIWLGPKWGSAVPPLRILLLVAGARCLYSYGGAVFRSLGRPQVELLFQVILCGGVAAAAAIGARHGITGVALGVGLFICLGAGPVFIGMAARAAGPGALGALRAAAGPAAAATVASAAALLAVSGIARAATQPSDLLLIAIGTGVGVPAYLLSLCRFAPDLLAEAVSRIRRMVGTPVGRARVPAAPPGSQA